MVMAIERLIPLESVPPVETGITEITGTDSHITVESTTIPKEDPERNANGVGIGDL